MEHTCIPTHKISQPYFGCNILPSVRPRVVRVAYFNLLNTVPEKLIVSIHYSPTPSRKKHWKFQGGREDLKGQTFKGKWEAKLEFSEG